MKNHKEIYTELQNNDIAVRNKALAKALALPMPQRLELSRLFQITDAVCDSINVGNEVFVLNGWSDAMISFYFQTFHAYVRDLDGQIISLNLASATSYDCADYEGPEPEQSFFDTLIGFLCDSPEWVKKGFHDHPILQFTGIGTRLVQCLIEDSSSLAWIPGVYLLNGVHCSFQSLDCRYLQPHGSIGDGESPHFFFESCSFESIVNLEYIYGCVSFGLTYSTIKAPLQIPQSTRTGTWGFIPILSLSTYIELSVEQRNFGALALLGEPGNDYRWLRGAEIIDLIVSWRTLHVIWPSVQENPPKIKALTIVRDNDIQMYSNTLVDLPDGIETCGIEILVSDSALQDFDDSPEGIHALMKMYAQLPDLKHVFFPY
ncbi:MAG: hypothetical protein VX278_14135, partial [Myxococcota bacterium]|nr:hypothetical protein [Myxococcota bacterium]